MSYVSHSTHPEPHVLPLKNYFGVFGILVFLTLITVWVSHMNLGPISIYVALVIAFIKACLVAAIFMHLKYDNRFNAFVFASSLLFLAIFVGLTFLDLKTRDWVLEEQGNTSYIEQHPWKIEYKKPENHH